MTGLIIFTSAGILIIFLFKISNRLSSKFKEYLNDQAIAKALSAPFMKPLKTKNNIFTQKSRLFFKPNPV